MRFSVRVTQRDYIDAGHMIQRKTFLRHVILWPYLAITCIVWLALGIAFLSGLNAPNGMEVPGHRSNPIEDVLSTGLWLLAGGASFIAFRAIRLRWEYRNNPNLRAEICWTITAEGISVTSTMGDSSTEPWTVLKFWRESRQVLLLVYPSGIYHIIPKANLSAAQIEELRSLLTTALPER